MLISLVTPVKNGIPFISDCIRSVQALTDNDLLYEHIFVDGGSTDGTVELLTKTPSITLLSLPGESALSSTLRGIRAAKGAYILLVMADDVVTADIADVAEAAGLSTPHAPDMILAGVGWVDEALNPTMDARGRTSGSPPRRMWSVLNEYPGLNGAIFKRELLNELDVPQTLPQTNDRLIMSVLLARARDMFFSETPIVRMRHHGGSTTMSSRRDVHALKAEMVKFAQYLYEQQTRGTARDIAAAFLAKTVLSFGIETLRKPGSSSRLPSMQYRAMRLSTEIARGIYAILTGRDRFAPATATRVDKTCPEWVNRVVYESD